MHRDMRRFEARLSEIPRVTAFVLDFVSALNLDEVAVFDLRLAVTETFSNIVEHSYGSDLEGSVSLNLSLDDEVLQLDFTDAGRRPEPGQLKSRNLEEYRERGLGLFLISRCMDDVDFHFDSDGMNHVRMVRHMSADRSKRSREHNPFHAALFEKQDEKTICLVGTFDRSRANPFANPLLESAKRTILDLSALDFIDSFGMKCLLDYFRASAKKGHRVVFVGPSERISQFIGAAGAGEAVEPSAQPAETATLSGWIFPGEAE